jgi:hypothetical protein
MSKVLRIERVEPRPGKRDEAYRGQRGYQLGDPKLTSDQRKRVAYSRYVATLEEAAHLVEVEGWHIRMGDSYREASLIQPSKVRIVRT